MVVLVVVAALLVGSVATYFVRTGPSNTTTEITTETVTSTTTATSFGSVYLQLTTITTVSKTTLSFGGTTYTIATGEYSDCIPPIQCYLTTITTWVSITSSSTGT